MKILVVVDMQNDFIGGALGTAEAQAIVSRVAEKIRSFDGKVIYTRDTHEDNYLETQEGRLLPVAHCIKGTEGWKLHPDIESLRREDDLVIDKPSFGSVDLAYALGEYELAQEVAGKNYLESVTFVGLCTDICVVSNVMIAKAVQPEVPVIVDAACCAGTTPEGHRNALDVMKTCQAIIENI